MYEDKNFMFFRRSSLLLRTIDAIEKKNIDDFDYLPTKAYIGLLNTSESMDIGKESITALQKFLCQKVLSKRIWNDGDI